VKIKTSLGCEKKSNLIKNVILEDVSLSYVQLPGDIKMERARQRTPLTLCIP